MRKDQLIEKKVKNQFDVDGRIPSLGDINISDSEVYSPQTAIMVPKKQALSSAVNHRSTVDGLYNDFNDLLSLSYDLSDYINQLRKAVDSEGSKITAEITKQHRRIVRLASAQAATDVFVQDIPVPFVQSSNIAFNGHLTLSPLSTSEVSITQTSVVPYSDRAVKDYTTVDKASFPLEYNVESDGKESGVEITLQFNKQVITRLELIASPCLLKVMVDDDNGARKVILKKHIDHRLNLQFDDLDTDHLILRFYQYMPNSHYEIELCVPYGEVYSVDGVYISTPVSADYHGILKFNIDYHISNHTDIRFYVGSDRKVFGAFNADPDSKESKVPFKFLPSNSTQTALSKLYKYSTIPGVPVYEEPDWVEVDINKEYYYNCGWKHVQPESFNTVAVSDTHHLTNLGKSVIPESVNLVIGKDAWIYLPWLSRMRQIDAQAIASSPELHTDYWTSYVIVKSPGILTISNPDSNLRDIVVQPVEVTEGGFPDTDSMFDRTSVTFSGTLPVGIYSIQLHVPALDDVTELVSDNATELSGITPDTIVTLADDMSVILYPWPAKQTSDGFNHIDPLIRHRFYYMSGGSVVVPVQQKSEQFDIYHPKMQRLRSLYSNQDYLSYFYDINYLEKADSSHWSKYLFFRADMSTIDNKYSPVIRSWEIQVNPGRFQDTSRAEFGGNTVYFNRILPEFEETIGHWVFDNVYNARENGGGNILVNWKNIEYDFSKNMVTNSTFDNSGEGWTASGPVVFEEGVAKFYVNQGVVPSISQNVNVKNREVYSISATENRDFRTIDSGFNNEQQPLTENVDNLGYLHCVDATKPLIIGKPYLNPDEQNAYTLDNIFMCPIRKNLQAVMEPAPWGDVVEYSITLSDLSGTNPAYAGGSALKFNGTMALRSSTVLTYDNNYDGAWAELGLDPMTIEVRFNPTDVESKQFLADSHAGDVAGEMTGYAIFIEGGYLKIRLSDNNARAYPTNFYMYTDIPITANTEYYLAVSIDPNNRKFVYLNGKVVYSAVNVMENPASGYWGILTFGRDEYYWESYYTGYMSEARMSRIAYSEQYIDSLYKWIQGE